MAFYYGLFMGFMMSDEAETARRIELERKPAKILTFRLRKIKEAAKKKRGLRHN